MSGAGPENCCSQGYDWFIDCSACLIVVLHLTQMMKWQYCSKFWMLILYPTTWGFVLNSVIPQVAILKILCSVFELTKKLNNYENCKYFSGYT